jgi:hypothetical protein
MHNYTSRLGYLYTAIALDGHITTVLNHNIAALQNAVSASWYADWSFHDLRGLLLLGFVSAILNNGCRCGLDDEYGI